MRKELRLSFNNPANREMGVGTRRKEYGTVSPTQKKLEMATVNCAMSLGVGLTGRSGGIKRWGMMVEGIQEGGRLGRGRGKRQRKEEERNDGGRDSRRRLEYEDENFEVAGFRRQRRMLGEEEMDLLRKRNRVEIRVEEITMELEMVQLKNREMA